MENQVAHYQPPDMPLTAVQIKAQVQRIQEVMAAVMEKDVHYGTIPGTQKPTLYKPGSEKILSTFRIAAIPKEIIDLSTPDEVRYQVKVHGVTMEGGLLVGVGIGECSSNEEKYKWRKPVCDEEFNEAPEDRRRIVWKKYDGKAYQQKQVRTNPADVANTILKMAKKRGQIDMTLTATAASDVFEQDLEDMSDELRESVTRNSKKQQTSAPKSKEAKPTPPPAQGTTTTSSGSGNGHALTPKEQLQKELDAYCPDRSAQGALLKQLTFFKGKDGDVFVDSIDDKNFTEKWINTTIGKLRKKTKDQPQSQPGVEDTHPEGCTKNHKECPHSKYDDQDKVWCSDGWACAFATKE